MQISRGTSRWDKLTTIKPSQPQHPRSSQTCLRPSDLSLKDRKQQNIMKCLDIHTERERERERLT